MRRQLVVGVSTIVTVVVLAVGIVSIMSLRTYFNVMNDAEVDESLDSLVHSYARYRHGESGHPGGVDHALLGFTGQNAGNIIAVVDHGEVIGTAVFFEDDPRPASPDVVAAIKSQPWHDGELRTVKLGGLGSFRVSSQSAGADENLVVGVPLDLANRTINRRIVSTTVLLVAALLVTAGLTALLVGYALRPLRRVAATAADVAGTPLTGDDHRITTRVQPDDTDPDTEVGIVGHTLNRLLDNVDSALAHRAESDRRMRQFITDASHELRTPLAAIRGYSELTRQDSADLPPTTEYALARIESEATRMTSLVDELLLLSRLGEGEDLRTEDVDLGDVVLNAVNDAAVAAPGHHWVRNLPDDPVWVRGDPDRLHQLVSNLLTNGGFTLRRGDGDNGNHLPSPERRSTFRGVDGGRRRSRYRPRSASASFRSVRAVEERPATTDLEMDWAWRLSIRSSKRTTARSALNPLTVRRLFGCGYRSLSRPRHTRREQSPPSFSLPQNPPASWASQE